MANEVERWCSRVYRNDRSSRSLVISGVFGCGKTRAMRSAQRFVEMIYMDVWPEYWPRTIRTQFVDWGSFVIDVEARKNLEFYEDVCAADVVFIDDIGCEEDRFKSGGPARILGDLLGKLETKFTFITTNIPENGWAGRWDPRVEDRLHRRNTTVCDLWALECGVLPFSVINAKP